MLSRVALLVLVVITCTTAAYAGSWGSKLIGKWLWHSIDAEAVLTFQPDHTYVFERTGFEHHDIQKASWRRQGKQLTITWQNADKTTYTIVKLTSDTLVLHSEEAGKETFSRIK